MSRRKNRIELRTDLPTTLDSLDTGNGVDVSLSDTLPNGELKATFFASNKVPSLKAGTGNMKRNLKISYSSVANDNKQLLHLLFKKSKS